MFLIQHVDLFYDVRCLYTNVFDWLPHANLVVDRHHRHQHSVWSHGRLQ